MDIKNSCKECGWNAKTEPKYYHDVNPCLTGLYCRECYDMVLLGGGHWTKGGYTIQGWELLFNDITGEYFYFKEYNGGLVSQANIPISEQEILNSPEIMAQLEESERAIAAGEDFVEWSAI